jgi:thioredoxin reductase (NADPH)
MAASSYDCIIVGGGIAGLQGAIQLGRYMHRTLVIDKGKGRSTLCRSYHNVLGWPDGVSGAELRRLGRLQAEKLGVQFIEDEVIRLTRSESGFIVETGTSSQRWEAKTVLLATGLSDRFPDLPGLVRCMGLTVYVCPDCDGYEVKDLKTVVMGAGDVGASMALTLYNWTNDLTYINHEWNQSPISHKNRQQLMEKEILYIEGTLLEVMVDESADGHFRGARLVDGQEVGGERGFIAFGGNVIHSTLAEQVGAELLGNKHIITNPRTKMTRVPGLWAAGDIGVHAEQLTIAMGEGAQAAIWMHKEFLKQNEKMRIPLLGGS